MFHWNIAPSELTLTILFPSGEMRTFVMSVEWPSPTKAKSPSSYLYTLTILSLPPITKNFPSGVMSRPLIVSDCDAWSSRIIDPSNASQYATYQNDLILYTLDAIAYFSISPRGQELTFIWIVTASIKKSRRK